MAATRVVVINPDSGAPVIVGEAEKRLLAGDFKKAKLGEIIGGKYSEGSLKERRRLYSALWQADGNKIRRFSPVDYIGRYMPATFCTT